MIRTDGKVYDEVKKELRRMGMRDLETLKIFSMGRGAYHEIVLNDRIVGSYNHRTRIVKLDRPME